MSDSDSTSDQTGSSSRMWLGTFMATSGMLAWLVITIYSAAAVFAPDAVGQSAAFDQRGIPDFIESLITNPVSGQDNATARQLATQETLAALSVWTFIVALFSIIIAGLGTFFLVSQVKQTRDALEQAREANNIAEKTAINQIRSYLTASPGRERGDNAISLVNSGSSPALNTDFRVDIFLSRSGSKENVISKNLRLNIPAHHKEVIEIDRISIDGDKWADYHTGRASIEMQIQCRYSDIYKEKRKTSVSYFLVNEVWVCNPELSEFT